jgi:hypothetical protein
MTLSPTGKQLDYILTLANKLTGGDARYLSQSSVLPKSVRSSAEASGLIDDLLAAIEVEEKRQAGTGIVADAKIRCAFVRQDGTAGRLAGAVTGLHWSGMKVDGVYLHDVEASWVVKGSWFRLDRMSDVRIGDGPEALKAERERLAARIAEIDALLKAKAG